jgi:hypothetical protein
LGQRNINVERKGGRTNRWKGILKTAVAISELITSPPLRLNMLATDFLMAAVINR